MLFSSSLGWTTLFLNAGVMHSTVPVAAGLDVEGVEAAFEPRPVCLREAGRRHQVADVVVLGVELLDPVEFPNAKQFSTVLPRISLILVAKMRPLT